MCSFCRKRCINHIYKLDSVLLWLFSKMAWLMVWCDLCSSDCWMCRTHSDSSEGGLRCVCAGVLIGLLPLFISSNCRWHLTGDVRLIQREAGLIGFKSCDRGRPCTHTQTHTQTHRCILWKYVKVYLLHSLCEMLYVFFFSN